MGLQPQPEKDMLPSSDCGHFISYSSLVSLLSPFFPFPLSQTDNLGFMFNRMILEPLKSPIFQNRNWLVDEIPLISQLGVNLNL